MMLMRPFAILGLLLLSITWTGIDSKSLAQSKEKKETKKPKPFTPEGETFSFEMPGEPKAMTQEKLGIEIKMWIFEAEDNTGVYMVAHNKLPDSPNEDQITGVLEGAAKGQFQGMNGELKKSNPIKLAKKYKGVECEGEVKIKEGIARSRIYIVGDSMYQVMVLGKKDFVNSDASKAFLESFQLREEK